MERIITDNQTKESYKDISHQSGLKVMVYEKPAFTKTYAIIATKYGSIDSVFELGDQKITVPDGIAHFLEHKLFENEKSNAFEQYAKTGANANAYTSFDKTAYLFSCTDKLYESLEILLNLTFSPYFTGESVQKEQGIIAQEISMYDDDPNWQVFFNMLRGAYNEHPVRLDIAGTKETIAKITPELLYKCHSTFYNPAEMVLCVCGNVSAKQVMAVVDKIVKKTPLPPLTRIYPDEKKEVRQKEVTTNLAVSVPLFYIGIKDDITHLSGFEFAQRNAQVEFLLELLVGHSSELYSSLYEKGLINSSFNYEYMISGSFGIAALGGEGGQPDEVYKLLFEQIDLLKKNGISGEDFLNCKKAIYGSTIRRFNNVEKVANDLIMCYFNNITLFDILKAYRELTLDDVKMRLDKLFCKDNTVISTVVNG